MATTRALATTTATAARTTARWTTPVRRAPNIGACQSRALHYSQRTRTALAPAALARTNQPKAAALASSSSRWRRAAAYSTSTPGNGEGNDTKIWDFEGITNLIQDPKHKIVIVDVREPNELQDTGKIPGAINIPIKTAPDSFHISEDEFEDRFGYPRPPKDAEIAVYCRSGVRSRAAAELAKNAGWTNVGEYPGSWLDWAAKGGKVER